MTLHRVIVVGAGLVGTSVALALRAENVEVFINDRDPRRIELAADLGAGTAAPDLTRLAELTETPVDIAVLAVPPVEVVSVLMASQRRHLAESFSDVTSIKSQPQADAKLQGADLARFVGGHPLAGRERAGPEAARGDLFLGRPWVLTPTADTGRVALAAVTELVQLCGAQPLVLSPEEHDEAVALVSHLPQAVASLLAARLRDIGQDTVDLAGQGFRDLTRIADSDPQLWGQIAAGNAHRLSSTLRALATDLLALADRLDDPHAAAAAFEAVVAAGNAGRLRLPGKHGAAREVFTAVPVVLADEPGTLARLLVDAGGAGVNVEDLSLEHSPGAPVGLCELLVRPEQAEVLATVLRARGWAVHHSGAH
jgi:prephenate dehydrogenase